MAVEEIKARPDSTRATRMFDGRFAGRTAIVTGGASGLGRLAAARITAEGGTVMPPRRGPRARHWGGSTS